jgi:hypothetical protein
VQVVEPTAAEVVQVVEPTAAEVEQRSELMPHHNCSKRLRQDYSEPHTMDKSCLSQVRCYT